MASVDEADGEGVGADAQEGDAEAACQACSAPITWVEPSFACDLGCAYCTGCADDLAYTCPGCEGTLRRRPSRARAVSRGP